jgi:hypothetical protein
MTTISDLNYVLNVLGCNEYEFGTHKGAFEMLSGEEERASYIKSLTDRSKMLNTQSKDSEGVNKGTATTVKATKAAAELAKAEGVALSTVTPNAEGKIGVEEVKAAVNKP